MVAAQHSVGPTPAPGSVAASDVAAAHGSGAVCVAVATGVVDAAGLKSAAPEHLFDDLASVGVIDAILGIHPAT